MDSANRIVYIDYLRLLATIGVVIIHVALTFTQFSEGDKDFNWHIVNIIESTVRWSVPLFVMISGVGFLSVKGDISLKELYGKYILRLLLVYIFWNVFYFMCSCVAAYIKGMPMPDLTRLLEPYGHLWFLPMLIGVYVVIPFLRTIKDGHRGGYFILLWALYLTICHILGDSMLKQFLFYFFLGYSGFFLLGPYLHENEKINNVHPFVWIILFLLSIVYIMILTAYCTGGEVIRVKYYEYISPLVVLSSISIFMIIKSIRTLSRISCVLNKMMSFTRKDLFGVYLIHLFWIDILPHIRPLDSFIHSNVIVGIPVMTILIFFLALFSTKLIRLIPLVNKIV